MKHPIGSNKIDDLYFYDENTLTKSQIEYKSDTKNDITHKARDLSTY